MWLICDNLKGFLTTRPPLTLFLICLGGFTMTLLVLAYQVKSGTLRNPDEMDWNDFLNGFKKVQFCIKHDDSQTDLNTTDPNMPLPSLGYKDVISSVHSNILHTINSGHSAEPHTEDPNEIVSLSIPLWVEVKPTEEFVSFPHDVTHLSTQMSGKHFGLEGVDSDLEFNLTFSLPYPWNKSLCDESKDCRLVRIRTCINFQAPVKLFPNSRFPDRGHCEMINSTGGVETSFKLVSQERSVPGSGQALCDKMAITVTHEEDSSLYIMLTNQDRSVINLHLIHTSFFLFVMVITLFCYAIIKGKAAQKSKPIQYSEVPSEV